MRDIYPLKNEIANTVDSEMVSKILPEILIKETSQDINIEVMKQNLLLKPNVTEAIIQAAKYNDIHMLLSADHIINSNAKQLRDNNVDIITAPVNVFKFDYPSSLLVKRKWWDDVASTEDSLLYVYRHSPYPKEHIHYGYEIIDKKLIKTFYNINSKMFNHIKNCNGSIKMNSIKKKIDPWFNHQYYMKNKNEIIDEFHGKWVTIANATLFHVSDTLQEMIKAIKVHTIKYSPFESAFKLMWQVDDEPTDITDGEKVSFVPIEWEDN